MIALYKGVSVWPSRCIQFLNWSEYSHAAFICRKTGECIEAWSPGGVRRTEGFGEQHQKGTRVDFFEVIGITQAQEDAAKAFMLTQLGKPYDWRGVVHFITRPTEEDTHYQKEWFCSELVFEAYLRSWVNIFERIPAYKVYPGMLAISPKLRFCYSRVV